MIDYFSCVSIPLNMLFEEKSLAHGTAFFYERANNIYLVTNLHNLSGRNPITGKCLNENGAVPNKIIFSYFFKDSNNNDLKKSENISFLLQKNGFNIWAQSPDSKVDIAIIPLQLKNKPISINENNQTENMAIKVGVDTFVLGFPIKCFTGILPIWKRATIASEPHIPIDGLDKVLIDTATDKGMSGSPVLLRSYGVYTTTTGTVTSKAQGSYTKLLGVYSGRHLSDEKLGKVGLGIVWKKELIDLIIEKGVYREF